MRRRQVLEEQADERERAADVDRSPPGGAIRRSPPASAPPVGSQDLLDVGTREVSVNTITRSPAWSTSSLRGNTAVPSRTIAPIIAPRIGMSRNRRPTYSLVGCVVMSSTS